MCQDMERMVQDGEQGVDRARRARDELSAQLRNEEAKNRASMGVGDVWEIDPAELSLSDLSLGTGNSSQVSLGVWLHTDVAIRRFDWSGTLEQANLFCASMRRLASLNHPHLVLVIGAVVEGPDAPIVVQELLEQDMSSKVRQAYQHKTPFDARVVATYALHMMLAVRYLHEQELVHGAITSRKLLLDSENRAKLQYLPREAIRPAPEYCGQSEDIYDCGAVMVEMCTGSRLTSCNGAHVQAALNDVPWPRIREVAAKCLATAPDHRPSARAVIDMLKLCS